MLSPLEISYYESLKNDNSKLIKLSIKLNKWIDKVVKTEFQKLKTFVKGLNNDIDAVKAAVELDANNGLAEGNVNRLKNIKRQMYGKTGFNLLRIKVVLSKTG
ncbi:transposase [Marinilabiliaceae bacterium JC040]|nr:transposase [Marinilabiliaceae bacterium JC040]